MIAQLRGTIMLIDDAGIVIDVAGVGYAVTVSGKTRAGLSAGDAAVTLLTEMQVREDSMTLFGFVDFAEREAFRLLVTVQGVGAKAAMAILTVLGPDEIAAAVMSGDKAMVARAEALAQPAPEAQRDQRGPEMLQCRRVRPCHLQRALTDGATRVRFFHTTSRPRRPRFASTTRSKRARSRRKKSAKPGSSTACRRPRAPCCTSC